MNFNNSKWDFYFYITQWSQDKINEIYVVVFLSIGLKVAAFSYMSFFISILYCIFTCLIDLICTSIGLKVVMSKYQSVLNF